MQQLVINGNVYNGKYRFTKQDQVTFIEIFIPGGIPLSSDGVLNVTLPTDPPHTIKVKIINAANDNLVGRVIQ